ncbi:class I SAM-dependent methyltransferase [Kitasatospora azatica]|uniref:class I SAM-dependent methyltransferase n=1 Tax=Kitasatospora azatica TaxID=58347 RepID=UPI000560226F|nr:class I SAM-dependent methyltransferase [Kitasatospora azatica]
MTAAVVTATPTSPPPQRPQDIPGWFFHADREVFGHLLRAQTDAGTAGDLLELGSYLGRSAVLLGDLLAPGETLTVCDLFDSEAHDPENAAEMAMSYRETLTRRSFEANYLAFHPRLPQIVQAPTSVLADGRIPAGSCRFVHIDASHLYEHVAGDIEVARAALAEDGLVALDDYRQPHTPGVAAAVWRAVVTSGLRPVLLTPEKFYGTWGDPAAAQRQLLTRDWRAEGYHLDEETIAGARVYRLAAPAEPPTAPAPQPPTPPRRSTPRRLALDLLPPIATRTARRVLAAARRRNS